MSIESPVMLVPASHPNYQPARLLDYLMGKLGTHGDTALANKLGTDDSVIYRLRYKRHPLSAHFTILVMDASGLTLNEIRKIAGATP